MKDEKDNSDWSIEKVLYREYLARRQAMNILNDKKADDEKKSENEEISRDASK